MTLPFLQLSGIPFEQGLKHGEELKELIQHNIKIYFERFERECLLSPSEVLTRAEKYSEAIKIQNPRYFDAMRGIAEGSEFSLGEITALNVRFEIMYYEICMKVLRDGCTAFAVSPEATANGHLLIGQNWDWIPDVKGALVRSKEPNDTSVLSFTEAGIVDGKIGLNSSGLGLTISGLYTTDDDWSRLCKPLHVRCYEILRSRNIQDALRVITDEKRACSTNFLLAQVPGSIADVEAAPERTRIIHSNEGHLVHTNHFLDPEDMDVVEPPLERRKFSVLRHRRMNEFLGSKRPISIDYVQVYLRDHAEHPYSLCRHPDLTLPQEERYITVASMIMDLDARIMYISDRQPCENPYQLVHLR